MTRSSTSTTSLIPEENPLPLISTSPVPPSTILTCTDWAQVPSELPAGSSVIIEEVGQPQIIIELTDSTEEVPMSSEYPSNETNLSDKTSRPDANTSSFEDDHPLSLLLSPN